MNLIRNFNGCLRKSFVWKGRATRGEFWYFAGASTMLTTALALVAEMTTSGAIALLKTAVMIALIPASLAATVRRLHDRGHSALWAIAGIAMWLVIMGGLIAALLVQLAADSQTAWITNTGEWMRGPEILIVYAGLTVLATTVWITLLIMLVRKGTSDHNAYGAPAGHVDES